MWEHPLTDVQLQTLKKLGIVVIEPVVKLLACGDQGLYDGMVGWWVVDECWTMVSGSFDPLGKGALAPVNDIVAQVKSTVLK